jgi:hypothetical protein
MVPCLNIHTMLIFKRIICNSSILKYLKTTKPIQHISLSSNSHLLPTILKPRGFLHRFRSITFGCLSMASDALYPLTSVETSNNQETLFIALILISIELTTVCYFDKRLMPVTKLTQCFPHIDYFHTRRKTGAAHTVKSILLVFSYASAELFCTN